MANGFERPFKLSFRKEGQSYLNCFIAYGRTVKDNDFDYHLITDDELSFSPGNADFHRQGTYYMLITPRPNFIEMFMTKL